MPGDYRRPTKPRGIDWSALTPTCRSCGQKSGRLNADDLCPTCDPTEAVPPSKPKNGNRRGPTKRVTERSPRPRPQYERPAGPRRSPGGVRGPRALPDARALVVAYQNGATVATLAAAHGTTPKRVRAILDWHGVERRDDRATNSGSKPREYDDHTRAEVARLYAAGSSRTEVAETLGIPHKTVVTIMKRDGIPARQGQTGRRDGAVELKARIAATGVAAADINRWALDTGLMDLPKPGLPSLVTVEAWEAAHPIRQDVAS